LCTARDVGRQHVQDERSRSRVVHACSRVRHDDSLRVTQRYQRLPRALANEWRALGAGGDMCVERRLECLDGGI
jgi:hypothetical protein